MTIRWSEDARTDLRAVEAAITKTSARNAREMLLRISRRIAVLADHPRFGAVVPEDDDENLREVYEQPYRIIYRVHSDRVEIVAVVHSARRLPKGL